MSVPAILRPHVVAVDRQVAAGVSSLGEMLVSRETVIAELRCLIDPKAGGESMSLEGRVYLEAATLYVDGRTGRFVPGQSLEFGGVPFVAAFSRYAYPDVRAGDRIRASAQRNFRVLRVSNDYALYPVMEISIGQLAWQGDGPEPKGELSLWE